MAENDEQVDREDREQAQEGADLIVGHEEAAVEVARDGVEGAEEPMLLNGREAPPMQPQV